MENPRKATDVLLDLEQKVDLLLNMFKTIDLNYKVLSNKLNQLIDVFDKMQKNNSVNPPKFSIEAVQSSPLMSNFKPSEKQVPIFAEATVPVENNPVGFRRTSRPETFTEVPSVPKPIKAEAEIIVNQPQQVEVAPIKEKPAITNSINAIPVMQRIVDRNGKAIFLADVEVLNSSNERVNKARTNGAGKWMMSLTPGTYRVLINKRESLTKEKMESVQEITVDGSKSPLELPMAIIK
jgi:hypothetical protein